MIILRGHSLISTVYERTHGTHVGKNPALGACGWGHGLCLHFPSDSFHRTIQVDESYYLSLNQMLGWLHLKPAEEVLFAPSRSPVMKGGQWQQLVVQS